MILVKVISVVEPKVERPHQWDLFQLTLDDGKGKSYRADMSRVSYAVFKAEQELLAKGVDPILLATYHDAVREEAEYDSQE